MREFVRCCYTETHADSACSAVNSTRILVRSGTDATLVESSEPIDVSLNSRGSKTVFSGFFSVFATLFDRKSPICLRAVCRISNPHCHLCRVGSFRHSPQVAPFRVDMRPFCVAMRLFCVGMRHFCVDMRPFCVRSRTSQNSTCVGSPSIFLTIGIRMGAITSDFGNAYRVPVQSSHDTK